jgi:hypothetical protein
VCDVVGILLIHAKFLENRPLCSDYVGLRVWLPVLGRRVGKQSNDALGRVGGVAFVDSLEKVPQMAICRSM